MFGLRGASAVIQSESGTREFLALGPFSGPGSVVAYGFSCSGTASSEVEVGFSLVRTPAADLDNFRTGVSLLTRSQFGVGEPANFGRVRVGANFAYTLSFVPSFVRMGSGASWVLFEARRPSGTGTIVAWLWVLVWERGMSKKCVSPGKQGSVSAGSAFLEELRNAAEQARGAGGDAGAAG